MPTCFDHVGARWISFSLTMLTSRRCRGFVPALVRSGTRPSRGRSAARSIAFVPTSFTCTRHFPSCRLPCFEYQAIEGWPRSPRLTASGTHVSTLSCIGAGRCVSSVSESDSSLLVYGTGATTAALSALPR